MNIVFKSLFLTLAIILVAFLLAKYFDDQRVSILKKELESVIQDNLAQQALAKYISFMGKETTEYCEQLMTLREEQAKRNVALSEKVKEYEKKSLFNEDYDFLKRSYYIALIDMYVSEFELKTKCNKTDVIVAYFYSVENKCQLCNAQNQILLKVIEKCQNVRVFSFPVDGNVNLPFIFSKRYSINYTPSIVINDEKKLEGLYSITQLIDELKLHGAVCN